jgi:peptide chain release factor 1
MIEKLKALKEKFMQITEQIADPEIIADQPQWQKLCKEHADLEPIV